MKDDSLTSAKAKVNRRNILIGLTASAAAVAGCKQTPAPATNASAPCPVSDCPVDNASTAAQRGLLCLWLLMMTNQWFVKQTTIGGKPTQWSLAPDMTNLMKDLSGLPSGPVDGSPTFIDAVLAKLNSVSPATKIKYGDALMTVQGLFQYAGTVKAFNGGTIYQVGEPGCPKDISDIMRVATKKPLTTFVAPGG